MSKRTHRKGTYNHQSNNIPTKQVLPPSSNNGVHNINKTHMSYELISYTSDFSVNFDKQANLALITLLQGVLFGMAMQSEGFKQVFFSSGLGFDSATFLCLATIGAIFTIYWQGVWAVKHFRWGLDYVHQSIYFILAVCQGVMILHILSVATWFLAAGIMCLASIFAFVYNIVNGKRVFPPNLPNIKVDKDKEDSIVSTIIVFVFASLCFTIYLCIYLFSIKDTFHLTLISAIGLIAVLLDLTIAYSNSARQKKDLKILTNLADDAQNKSI
jgi:hypothetical protein